MRILLIIIKFTGIVLLYILSGLVLTALFVGGLFLTNGAMSGYIAFAATLIIAGFWAWFLFRRSETTGGFLLRSLPSLIAVGIVTWAMIPLPQHDFSGIVADERFEFLDLENDRIAAVARFTPEDEIAPRGKTIVFVHGGPGAYLRDFDLDFIAAFSEDGFDVLTYDQIGAGRSSIIDTKGYSHQGNVSDLNKILGHIDTPVILIGQSYGAALVTSFLDSFGHEHDISHIILTEPGPLPGADYSTSDDKTTKAENAEGLSIPDILRSPRIILAFLLPASNRFSDQEELLNFISPGKQKKAVATSYCAQHSDQMLPFEHHRVNLLATRIIMDSFLEAETPDLTAIESPVMMLLGECSYIPRNYALDYFDHFSITRSHLIRDVGHILWATPEGRSLTHESILRFIDGKEPILENKPTIETRDQFFESGL